ncbi:flagella synthesis protein FlgN [Zhongshania arctica]|uniref:Flagella synthesis protein FlgN n=1 Tax=Zhongshania arctica TaxID=3238302 RepID=A0ABV3TVT4_9GAMM
MTELSDVIQHIHSHACELESVLLSEASNLKRADSAENIEAIAIQKMDLVQALDQLALRRRQLIDDSSDGDQYDRDPVWQDALAILSRCQMLNNQAGADITVQSRYKQRALEILGTPHAETQLYSASGAAQFAGPKQALGKA